MAKIKYDEDFPARAEDWARQGLRDEDIAKKLGISRETFYQYKKTYSDFSDALKKGKAPIDFEVENSLLKRARGFEYEEVHIEYKPGKKGKDEKEELIPISIKKIKKIVIPDTTACIFWSKNRRPRRWRDKHDIDLGGGVLMKIITAVPRSTKPKGKDEQKKPKQKKEIHKKGTKTQAPGGQKKGKKKSKGKDKRRK